MKSILGIVAALAVSAAAAVAQQSVDEQIAERIAPAGKTCMKGEECAAAVAAAPEGAGGGGTRSGEDIYNASCQTCHALGVAGAPKFGDAAAWAPRIAQGMDTLYSHAINGFNAMPAKGLCMDCSDDEVKAAVDYMADNSK
ncbi:c-type cytochrome [Microbulbifer sp. ZKSA006]|uniref:c-type cytochrome n=1 Tax=Microbulbifer sp. ZKSA006 TaxID=3243390 RepID=UPI00403A57EE